MGGWRDGSADKGLPSEHEKRHLRGRRERGVRDSDVVVQVYNPSTGEVEKGGTLRF